MSALARGPNGGHQTAGEQSPSPRGASLSPVGSESDNDPVARDNALLSSDPLGDLGNGLDEQISFKRKRKERSRFNFSNLLFSPSAAQSRGASPSPLRDRARQLREQSSRNSSGTNLNEAATGIGDVNGTKDGAPLDWYVEGPGRRVGYDDMTAIDWIFEYAKERQRTRILYSNTPGLVGYLRQILDASHVWVVLILTGIAVGLLAASIDVVSDWLGDSKTGYCRRGEGGGKFYLNKGFCCWGHEGWSLTPPFYVHILTVAEEAQCSDWSPWRDVLQIRSRGAGYIVEYILYALSSIVFAACASILVKNYAVYARHSGIPEIKTVLGGFVIRRFMGAWTLVIKSLGLCLAVASGLWLGKEGPLVHVACCCANLIMKPFASLNNNEARKREILSAAAAAGISVAFGSPIGGVLFSLEQLSYYFPDKTMWQSFVCAMVAAVTLQALNPFRTEKIVLFQVTYSSGWHDFEMVPYLTLGVLGGVYGGLFIKLNMRVARWRKESSSLRNSPVWEVVIVTLFTAVVTYPNIFMRAQTSELVYSLFAECAAVPESLQFGLCKSATGASIGTIVLLLVSAILGFLLASVTFGMQIPAGIILPSVAIGALYGRALGIGVELWHNAHPELWFFRACEPDIPCVTPGTYAIIGAASALGGVTRMTVSIVVIMFELTGALTYVLPIMIAVMVSKWIGDAFSKRGIYESWIHFNEYPFLDNKDDTPAPDVPVSSIMTRVEDLTSLTAVGHTIRSLNDVLAIVPYRGFPVISKSEAPILLGYISRVELTYALKLAVERRLPPDTPTHFSHQPSADPRTTLDLRPWMDQTPITLNSQSTLQLTVSMFQKLGLRYVLFTSRGVLQGLLTKKDVWYVLNGAEDRRSGGDLNGGAIGAGALREEGVAEDERGLLQRDDAASLLSPAES